LRDDGLAIDFDAGDAGSSRAIAGALPMASNSRTRAAPERWLCSNTASPASKSMAKPSSRNIPATFSGSRAVKHLVTLKITASCGRGAR